MPTVGRRIRNNVGLCRSTTNSSFKHAVHAVGLAFRRLRRGVTGDVELTGVVQAEPQIPPMADPPGLNLPLPAANSSARISRG